MRNTLYPGRFLTLFIVFWSLSFANHTLAAKGGKKLATDQTTQSEPQNLLSKKRNEFRKAQRDTTDTSGDSTDEAAPKSEPTPVEDSQAPLLSLPGDIYAEASSTDGSVIIYQVSAVDSVDGNVNVSCHPASNTVMPIGKTTVQCTASDLSGNFANGSFHVFVNDTVAPILIAPDQITHETLDSAGDYVTFDVSATDNIDSEVNVLCTPSSGERFPIGETTVECNAQDNGGNIASAYFQVNVTQTPVVEEAPTFDIALQWVAPIQREDGSPLYANDIATYELYYSDSTDQENGNFLVIDAVDENGHYANSATITGLSGGTYYFSISAIDHNGQSSRFSTPAAVQIN